MFHYSIPSYVLGAQYPVFGSLYDPIGPSIAADTAAIALWSPGTWAAASAAGQAQGQGWTMGLQSLSSFGSSAYDYVNGLSSMVQFFGGGL